MGKKSTPQIKNMIDLNTELEEHLKNQEQTKELESRKPKKKLIKRPLFWFFTAIILYLIIVFLTNIKYILHIPEVFKW